MIRVLRSIAFALPLMAMCAALLSPSAVGAPTSHTSKRFAGVKANTGTVTHSVVNERDVLTLSDDFKVPDAPAPHWQLVDSTGNAYLLNRLVIKGEKLNKTLTVPDYVPDITRVQIWCAFAEVLLGETTFDSTIMLQGQIPSGPTTSSRFQGVKANSGSVTHKHENGRCMLTLSDEFVVPDTPAPHWQLVDSRGRTYLLQRLQIKDGVFHKSIAVPSYVQDIAAVQIWCAWAETLLGEATFESPVH